MISLDREEKYIFAVIILHTVIKDGEFAYL